VCTVSAPPTFALAWPWQAPGSWLVLGGALAVVAVLSGLGAASVRREASPLRQRVGWAFVLAMALSLSAGVFLVAVINPSTTDALFAWMDQQTQALHAQGCSPAPLVPLFDGAFRASQYVDSVGLVLAMVGCFLVLLVRRLYPRKPDQATAGAH